MEIGEIVFVLVVVTLAFFVKGVTGLGGPPLVIPVIATFMGVEWAVAVVAIPGALSNGWLLVENRHSLAGIRPYIAPILAMGAIGVVVGVKILLSVDDRIMSIVLGVLMLLYIVWYLFNPATKLGDRTARWLAWPTGLAGGVLHGTTGVAAPVIGTYAHSLRLPRSEFVAAISLPFVVLGTVQMVSLLALGGYDQERLLAGLAVCVPVLIVTPYGMRLGRRISVQAFQYAVLAVLGLAAIRLLMG